MKSSPGKKLGHYRLLEEIGRGGMGVVYRALDTKLEREVALKVLPKEATADPERLERFRREAKAVAALNHPGIVTIYSVEEAKGTHFLTMELVSGRTLQEMIPASGMSQEQICRIGIPLAQALAAAHQRGIAHRDLKPSNVVVTGDGRLKVLDFGLAKLLSPRNSAREGSDLPTRTLATGEGMLLGTVPYMSPEQLSGKPIDARTDIFSLGVILHEMGTGKRPFSGESFAELASSILRDDPGSISDVRSDLPELLGSVTRRCLEKDPGRRYQSALEVSSELQNLESGRSSDATAAAGSKAPGSRASIGAAITKGPDSGLAPPSLATRTGPAVRERASIAVLPFDNLSGDPTQEYFADGIVEEIITGLSRIKWLLVISRNSTYLYKGKVVDVATVGRQLEVRYVLRGSVRRAGDRVRLTGHLAATDTAAHVWADRYEGTLGDLFALQDQMTMSIIAAVEPTLRRAEIERARRKRPESLDAYDLFLRALPFAFTAMPEDADRALPLLEEAIRLEPDYAAAHGFIAWCHEQRYLRGGLQADVRQAGICHAHAAIEAGSDDAMALAMGGFVVGILERDYDLALDALDRSLALSPSSALAFGFSSIVRSWKGQDREAAEHARAGIRLGPYDPLIYLPYIGLAYASFFMGDFEEAARAAGRAAAANPRFSVPRYVQAGALARLGRLEDARVAAKVALELQPGLTVSGLISGNITTPERMARLGNALREAGVPE